MQAIITRYHGPTTYRASCVSAQCEAGRIRVSYDYDYTVEGNHANAARTLLKKLGWTFASHGGMHGGQIPNGDYVWGFSEEKNALYTFAPDPV